MLLNTNNNSLVGKIVATKTVNGEEIIGKCVAITADTVTLSRPAIVKIMPIGNNQGAPMLTPFGFTFNGEGEFTLRLAQMIMDPVEVLKEAGDLYLRETSGIEIAQPGIQL